MGGGRFADQAAYSGAALAEDAISLGLPVFPCNADKGPLTKNGFKDATRDPAAIRRMFAKPGAVMIGVPTGRESGFVVVDVDVKDNARGEEWLDENGDAIPETRTHRTRSSGLHLLFLPPHGEEIGCSKGRVAPGVDVRGEGGYVIFPPTLGYEVADDASLAEMPRWLIAKCRKPAAPPAAPPRPPRDVATDGGGSGYGLQALNAECEAIRKAGFGSQEHTLNSAGLSIGGLVAGGELDEATALSDLLAAARCVPSQPGRKPWTQAELEQKIRRAFADGKTKPRQAPPLSEPAGRQARQRKPEGKDRQPEPVNDPTPDAEPNAKQSADDGGPIDIDPSGVELTQDGVAWAFAAQKRHRLAFDHTSQQWFYWVDGRWRIDATASAFHQVRVYCRALRDGAEDAPKDMAKIGFVANVERAVRTDPRLAVSHEHWDKDPWLLGVPGSVVDLRTGKMQPADPSLYIRRQTAVAPAAPGTSAPLWNAFLEAATGGDKQLQTFLQRLAGYLLTGNVTEEVLTFLYGSGGNGKGVFIGAVFSILGDYAVSVPIEVFVANSRLNLEYYRARMVGARLVTASETEAGATWSESLIKELTGNEAPLSARDPYGKAFNFLPQFKLCLVGNHAPRLKGRTPAMERRLRVVPFNQAPANPDKELKDKLRAEYPAILRWMLDGCADWQKKRLGTADAIKQATSTYFEAQDSFGRWLEERCIKDSSLSEPPSKVLADFTAWLRENGEPPVTSAEFREMMDREKGVRHATNGGKRWFRGIGLKAQPNQRDTGE